jgi:hypothetical protein
VQAWGLLTEEVLKTEFEVVHPQYAPMVPLTQFTCQGLDIHGEHPKLLVFIVYAVQFASLSSRRLFIASAVIWRV